MAESKAARTVSAITAFVLSHAIASLYAGYVHKPETRSGCFLWPGVCCRAIFVWQAIPLNRAGAAQIGPVLLQAFARISFATSIFLWALAGSSSLAASGWGALGALLIGLPLLLSRRLGGQPGTVLRDRYLWLTAGLFMLVNICNALATSLMPLAGFSAINQCSPVIGLLIAPLWGERAVRRDWTLVGLGIGGALLVIGASLPDSSPLGILAALGTIVTVSFSLHSWGRVARSRKHTPAVATLALVIPALLLITVDIDLGGRDILLYMCGGALLLLGNMATFITFRDGWTVVRSLLLKPLSSFFLALAGVLFLDDPVSLGLVLGGAMVLLASTGVALQKARAEEPEAPG